MISIQSVLSLAIVVKIALCKRGYIAITNHGSAPSFSSAEKMCMDTFGSHLASIHDISDSIEVKDVCSESQADICWLGSTQLPRTAPCKISGWLDKSSVDYQPLILCEGASRPLADCCAGRNACISYYYIGKYYFYDSCKAQPKDTKKKIYPICNPPTPSPTPLPTPEFKIIKTNYNRFIDARFACVFHNILFSNWDISSLHNEEEQKEAKNLCFKSGADVCWIGGTIQDKSDCSSVKWEDGSPTDFKPLYAAYENNWGCNKQHLCFIKGYGGIRTCADEFNNDGSQKMWVICNRKKRISAANAINIKPISYDDNFDNVEWKDWLKAPLSYLLIVVVVIMVNIFMYCFIYLICIKPKIRSASMII